MRRSTRVAGLLTIELGLLIVIAGLGDLRDHIPVFLVLFALASIAGLMAILAWRSLRLPLWTLLLTAIALRVPFFFTQPSLSDDVWRYIHDGRVQLAGVNPYRYAPADPATAQFRGPEFERINHRDLPTIYPPLAQYAFRMVAALPAPLLAWRLLLLAAELTTLLAAAALLRRCGAAPNNLALYAWHPLAIIETIGSAHIEALGIALLALALAFAGRGSQLRAGVALAASVATKLVAAPLAWVVARNGRGLLAVSLTLAILYAPFVMDGANALGSLGVFAERWESNSSIHALLTPLLGQHLYRLCAAAFVIGVVALMRLRHFDVIDAAAIYFLTLFVVAPVVHPWYLLWLLAVLPLRKDLFDGFGIAALFWSVSVTLAYTAIYQQQMSGEWRVASVFLLIQYVPLYVLLARHAVQSLPIFSITNLRPNAMNTAAKMYRNVRTLMR